MKLDQDFGLGYGGMLTDEQGRVRALYASYSEQVGLWEECNRVEGCVWACLILLRTLLRCAQAGGLRRHVHPTPFLTCP